MSIQLLIYFKKLKVKLNILIYESINALLSTSIYKIIKLNLLHILFFSICEKDNQDL